MIILQIEPRVTRNQKTTRNRNGSIDSTTKTIRNKERLLDGGVATKDKRMRTVVGRL